MASPVLVKPALEEEGELFVFLQPLPQEAEPLTFTLEGISAVKEGEGIHPLSLSLTKLAGGTIKRQRLLASGILPPGKYTGLSITVRSASLRGEEGQASLLAPEEPVAIGFPFRIARRKAYLLLLDLNYKKSVVQGIRFSPAFSPFQPDRPPVGLLGFVANTGSNNLTVFDKNARQVVDVIATGRGPRGIALGPGERRVYVALSEDDAVDVFDAESGESINRVRLHPGDNPLELAISSGGGLLFTANSGSDTVSVIDTVTLTEVDRIPVGNGPRSILLDRAGIRAYVFNTRSDTISVIDVASRSVAATIATVAAPVRGEFSRKGDRLYVIQENIPYMNVIDPSSLSLRGRAFVGAGIGAVKVDPRTDLIYFGRNPDTLEIFDPLTLFFVDTVPAGGPIAHMAVDSEENRMYLVLPEQRVLSTFHLISREVDPAVDVGDGASRVTLMGEK